MVAPRDPDKLSRRQRGAFTQRPDEDIYSFTARTYRSLRLRDLPQLMMVRGNDTKQVDAIKLYAELKMVQWTRVLAIGTFVLGACTIVAALIARS